MPAQCSAQGLAATCKQLLLLIRWWQQVTVLNVDKNE
jgi:hypothetical protein